MLFLESLVLALIEALAFADDPIPEPPSEERLWWPRGAAIVLWAILLALLVAVIARVVRAGRRKEFGGATEED